MTCAYLELTEPSLADAAATLIKSGVSDITILPMFLGVGRHAREDLPALIDALHVAHPHVQISCQPAVGEQSALLDLLADIALGGNKTEV